MTVLEVYHASSCCKMDKAAIKLETMELSTFPGETIRKFANEDDYCILLNSNQIKLMNRWFV